MRRFLQGQLWGLSHEVFACLFLGQRLRLIAFETLFRGTVDGATVHKREVARRALQHNASALIAVHNHPSGCPEPSDDDQRLTEAPRATLALIDGKLVDHIVVGRKHQDLWGQAAMPSCVWSAYWPSKRPKYLPK